MKVSEILLQDYDIEISNTRRTLERVPEGKRSEERRVGKEC